MSSRIPDFDHNLVIPPHMGNPTDRNQLSPYPCSSLDLCQRFATTPERIVILRGFLNFREKLCEAGLTTGFQWLDGSFLEDIETQESRPPADLDLVTVYWGYDLAFQTNLSRTFPEFANFTQSKATYKLDHYPFDAGYSPEKAVEYSRYWTTLFSHNRQNVWKGMLKIDLNTPGEDSQAKQHLSSLSS